MKVFKEYALALHLKFDNWGGKQASSENGPDETEASAALEVPVYHKSFQPELFCLL